MERVMKGKDIDIGQAFTRRRAGLQIAFEKHHLSLNALLLTSVETIDH
jgi:hypothetical protein